MTIKEIDKKIAELKVERDRLVNHDLEIAHKNVGRCFQCGGCEYIKILGEPEKKFDAWAHSYYGYSALILETDDDDLPFDFTDVSISFNLGHEVSQEEFNKQFENAVARLREKAGIGV